MRLAVTLPADRAMTGTLVLYGTDGAVRHRCAVLGKSDNAAAGAAGNPLRDPLRAMGDTPCGEYMARVDAILEPARSYGPHPVIRLTPISGDGIKSKRTGLLVHGGDKRAGRLRPTHGCLRTANEDQLIIVGMMGTRSVPMEVRQG